MEPKIAWDCRKLILITGANSGIGLEACKSLCERGHKVVATVRSVEKGEHCIREVKAVSRDADIDYMICEMSDAKSVRQAAKEFKESWLVDGQLLDTLVNNAGCVIFSNQRTICESNPKWEKTMAVNTIAPVLLTDLLMENLKETALKKGNSRVVMVSSDVVIWDSYQTYQTDLDDVMIARPKAYKGGNQTYKNSKVALMQATLAMVKELEGTGVTVNSMSPGFIGGTNLTVTNTPSSQRCMIRCFMCCLTCILKGESNAQGGRYLVQLADDDLGAESHGEFYIRGNLTSPTPQCLDLEKQTKMLQILRNLALEQET